MKHGSLGFLALILTGSACVLSVGGDPLPGYEAGTSGTPGGGGNPGGGGTNTGNTGGVIPTGAAWVPATSNLAGMESECGNIQSLSARPDRDMIIAGVSRHGLWASKDGSPNWVHLGQGAGSAEIINRMSGIVYDPVHPDTFWESGIYNGPGVYRTDDNGETFIQLGDTNHNDLVTVDLSDPGRKTLLAGGHETFGRLLKTTDGGLTWTNIGGKLPGDAGASSLPHILDSRTWLLGTYQANTAGIFRTTDAGETWTRVHTGSVSFSVTQGADGTLYWMQEASGGVKSTDQGATWTKLANNQVPIGIQTVELPDGRLLSAWDKHLAISGKGGNSWRNFGPELPWRLTGFLYSTFRKQIYVWHYSCGSGANPVEPDQIVRLDFDYKAS